MNKFKTKPLVTIDTLIQLTKNRRIVWKLIRSGRNETLECIHKVTKYKSIKINLISNGTNFFVHFYYNNKKLTTYYQQNVIQIYELYIYAKYISHILDVGEYEFIDGIIDDLDVTEWEEFNEYFSMDLDSLDNQTAKIYVSKGLVELCLSTYKKDKLLYQIYDDYLYLELIANLSIP